MNPEPPNVHTYHNKITQNPLTIQATVTWPNSPAYHLAIYILEIIKLSYTKNTLHLIYNLSTYIKKKP
jgi:hypothetical protein